MRSRLFLLGADRFVDRGDTTGGKIVNIFARGKAVSSFALQANGNGTLVRGANDDFLRKFTVLFLLLAFVSGDAATAEDTIKTDATWQRHIIDNSSRGADGVRLRDVNDDGLPDIATGWEEGGIVRVYLHPGFASAKQRWPAVTVGEVKSPEDAVLVDLDRDGACDVVSSCEGRVRTMFFHWAPRFGGQQSGAQRPQKFLDPAAWTTEAVAVTQDQQSWMFALPMDVDGRHGVDLIVGSRGLPHVAVAVKPTSAVMFSMSPTADVPSWDVTEYKLPPTGIGTAKSVRITDFKTMQFVFSCEQASGGRSGVVEVRPVNSSESDQMTPESFSIHDISGPAGVKYDLLQLVDIDGDGDRDVVTCEERDNLGVFWYENPRS